MEIPGFNKADFAKWITTRPAMIQEMARRLPPWNLYRIKTTGQRCTLHDYSENGTVIVDVTGQYNRILFSRTVFGLNPDDLEECNLPASGEDLGDTAAEAGYDEDDIREILIPAIKQRAEAREQTEKEKP